MTSEQQQPNPSADQAGHESKPADQFTQAGEVPPEMAAEAEAQMQAAMQGATSTRAEGNAGPGGAKPAIRGPRVVQAGREHRTGNVVSVGPNDIFVEFGPKELGVVPRLQYKDDELPPVGQPLEVVVDKFEPAESLYICSRPGAVQKADWELLEPGQVIEARVTGVNKGGLELEVAGHKAFMPAGQVSIDRVEDLSVFVGEKVKAAVTRVDRSGRGNIVLSRRDVIEAERRENAGKLKETLEEGQTVEGTVRKIMAFGAFVDLGGVDGLVHLSDMSYDRVGHGEKAVSKYVKEGQKVTVKILKLDWEAGRISLGLKQMQSDPFAQAAQAVTEGAELTGRVTKIMDFGAFVEVAPGVEGLVHISEIDYKRVDRVSDVLKADEVVQVKVLKIDPGNRRVSLSIKATKPAPEPKPGQKGGGRDRDRGGRSADEILKETPAFRRLKEKAKQGQTQFKGGLG